MAKRTFTPTVCRIKAIGVGGGGCNAINRMVRADVRSVEFVAVNTDAQALMTIEAPTRVQIGEKVSRGLGVGGDPGKGRQAAEENVEDLRQVVSGADMVFIAAGMGGGTGTGASPVIARLARESGALTIAIVTKPFNFEMARRVQIAEEGIEELEKEVDAMIVIPNERLLSITGDKVTVDNAFKMADDVLMMGVRAISEVITVPGMINLDFADVKAIMREAGPCWLSIGHGSGQNRVVEAARAAISSELLEVPIERGTVCRVWGAQPDPIGGEPGSQRNRGGGGRGGHGDIRGNGGPQAGQRCQNNPGSHGVHCHEAGGRGQEGRRVQRAHPRA